MTHYYLLRDGAGTTGDTISGTGVGTVYFDYADNGGQDQSEVVVVLYLYNTSTDELAAVCTVTFGEIGKI